MGSAIIPIYNFGNESVAVTLEVRPFTEQNFDMPRRLSTVFVYCQPSGSGSKGKVNGLLCLPELYLRSTAHHQVANGLVESLAGSGRAASDAQIAAAHQLASALEAEEVLFLALAGDPSFHPMQRTHFPIGKLLAAMKSHQDIYDVVAEQWTCDGAHGTPLAQRVAGLRLLLACLTAWGAESYPLSDDDFLSRVMRWASAEETVGKEPAARGDGPPADTRSYLEEAHATYATGLLAIALTVDEFADEAVRSGTICSLARYLQRSVLGTAGTELAPGQTSVGLNSPIRPRPTSLKSSSPAVTVSSPRVIRTDRTTVALVAPSTREVLGGAVFNSSEAAGDDGAADLGHQAEMLRGLREWYALQGTACLGEYLECLAPVMQERIVEVTVELLQKWGLDNMRLVELLRAVCALMAHRRYAEAMVAAGGLQLLLDLPKNAHTAGGLSLALFGLASLPTVFERVCSAPTASVEALARAALELASCPSARKNSVLFLGASLHYRPILNAFDSQDGLRRLLDVIRAATLALRGPGAGDLKTEKQVAYHSSHALQHYMRTHLIVHVAALQRRLGSDAAQAMSQAQSAGPLTVTQESVDAAVRALEEDRRLAVSFLRSRWAPLETFMDDEGPLLMLELVQASPGERYYNEMALYALDVLQVASLVPYTRRSIVGETVNSRSGMAILLSAAGGQAYLSDPEVMACASHVLVNLVTPPAALAPLLPMPASARTATVLDPSPANGWKETRYSLAVAQVSSSTAASSSTASGTPTLGSHIEQSYAVARAALRSANGIKVLLGLLGSRPGLAAAHVDRLRALAARVLLGLARDPSIRHILAKLQVGQVLAEHIQEHAGGSILRRSANHATVQEALPSWHVRFNKYALELIAATTTAGISRAGTMVTDAAAPALQRIERAAIAASTQITYPPHELLRLIQEHLKASGLHTTAAALVAEAGLAIPTQQSHKQQQPQTAEIVRPAGTGAGTVSSRRISIAPGLQRVASAASPAVGAEPVTPATASSRGMKRRASAAAAMRPPPALRDLAVTPKAASGAMLPAPPQWQAAHADSPDIAPGTDADWLGALDRLPAVTPFRGFKTPRAILGDGDALTSEDAPLISQLLSSMPRRSAAVPSSRPARGDTIASAVRSPPREPQHRIAARRSLTAAGGTGAQPTNSKLNSIVMQHLRHQHRAACMQSATPISTLPPMSLLKPNVLPQARRSTEAPLNATSRILRRQTAGAYGGFGGRRQQRHMIYSRFRHMRTIRDEDHVGLLKSACFLPSAGLIALGSHMGELRLYDSTTGEAAAGADDHSAAVNLLRSWQSNEPGSKSLLLSSSRQEVKLWDVSTLESGSLVTWEDCRGGHFDHAGTRAAAVGHPTREVRLFDLASGKLIQSLADPNSPSMAAGERSRSYRDAATFSPGDDLLLWGNTLWDPRTPRAIHRFDQFTDFSGGCFHPAGLEVLMNSEVWDLRTLSLLRSVPALDGAAVTFAGPDVLFAIQRPVSDDLRVMMAPRRSRHPLHTAFRTMDATDFSEISTTDAEGRMVLDLALDSAAGLLALVTVDAAEGAVSSARIYEIGRSRMQEDDSDADGGDEEDDDSEEEDLDSDTDEDEDEDEEAEGEVLDGELGAAAHDAALETALQQADDADMDSSSEEDIDGDSYDESGGEDDDMDLDFDGVSDGDEDAFEEDDEGVDDVDLTESEIEAGEATLTRSRNLLRMLIARGR